MKPYEKDIVTILKNEDAPDPRYFGCTDDDLQKVIKDEACHSALRRAARAELCRRQRIREAFLC